MSSWISSIRHSPSAIRSGGGSVIVDSNGDTTISGTLDVMGAATFDSTLAVSGNTGLGAVATTDTLFIKGATSDISANSLLVRNSSNTALFTIRNDGRIDTSSAQVNLGGTLTSVGAATLDTGANGSSFGGELTLDGGVLALAETTTPGSAAGEGRIYTKTDNKLYFQDGAGTEHEVAFV